MIDIANYRSLKEQYKALKVELEKFSLDLAQRSYAIALSRCDAISEEELEEKTVDFIKMLELEPNKHGKHFNFEKNIPSYCQNFESYESIDKTKPYFILPISSISRKNLEAIKYALLSGVKEARKGE